MSLEDRDFSKPPKRARREDDSGSDSEPNPTYSGIQHSEDFWFDDGNIVVVAHNTAYRLHRGVLARHSSVFDGLFKVPQPPRVDADESIAGCPVVVHISDPPDDFDVLLQALYEGPMLFQHNTPMACSKAVALLELAHKYAIDHVYDEAVERMRTCFTTRFSEWRILSRSFVCHAYQFLNRTEVMLDELGSPVLKIMVARDAIRAANAIRLVGDDSMLPIALFLCTQLLPDVLLAGTTRPDGTVDKLSDEDLVYCLASRTTFVVRQLARIKKHCQWGPSASCRSDLCADILPGFAIGH